MTVSANISSIQYSGNGVATVFSFAFKVVATTDLLLLLINQATLQKVALTLGVHYSVNLVSSEVTYPLSGSPMPVGYSLEIRRNAAFVQNTAYTTQGDFSPVTLEAALDYVTMLAQQLLQKVAATGIPLPTYEISSLPSALSFAPTLIYVQNAAGGGIPCFSDGTNWRRVDTRAIVS